MSTGLAVGLMIVCLLVGLCAGFVLAVVAARDLARLKVVDQWTPITIHGDPNTVNATAREVADLLRKQSMAQKGGSFL